MPDYVKIFSDSLARIEEHEGEKEDLVDRFYDQFLRRSPEAAERFAKTDMERQKQMLRDSFKYMLTFSTKRRSDEELERIARRHGKDDLDVAPRLYDVWLASLVAAVEELDPGFDRSVETAWRVVVAPGIELMKGHYESP